MGNAGVARAAHIEDDAVYTAHRLVERHLDAALLLARTQRSRCLLDRGDYAFWTQVCDYLEGHHAPVSRSTGSPA